MTRRSLGILPGLALLPLLAGAAGAKAPMSAIDWLSDSLGAPQAAAPVEAPVSNGVLTEVIAVRPIDAVSPDGVGLLRQSVTGLPADLWGSSDLDTLIRLIADFPAEPLPAVQDQFRQLMLAELHPPQGTRPDAPLLQARVDALLARGAVEEAEALLERAASNEPELFRRAFDVSLLTGREQAGCARMRSLPGLSPSLPVRIFCLARTGDWAAAALTLESAKALGQIPPEEDALLAQFLDPELAEMLPPTAAPARPSPLSFRMMEAIGASLPTTHLPLAFAHSDLRPLAGWKARVEAAERLARAGALPSTVLFGVYGEREPAASGGVWDRVAAAQAIAAALESGDATAIGAALPDAYARLHQVGLTMPLAQTVDDRLLGLDLPGAAAPLAARLGLLSYAYQNVARSLAVSEDADLRFLSGLALGVPNAEAPSDLAAAIATAWTAPALPVTDEAAAMVREHRAGEALLLALRVLADGQAADPADVTGALALLRQLGLEDTARRAGLQMLLLEGPA